MDAKILHFVMRADAVNDLQLESMRRVMNRARAAHFTNIDMRINGKNEISEADWLKQFREVSPRDVGIPVFYEAEDAACVHMCLDDRQVPRVDAEGQRYSLWGRVCEFVRMQSEACRQDSHSGKALPISSDSKPYSLEG